MMFALGIIKQMNAAEARHRADLAKQKEESIRAIIAVAERAIENASEDGLRTCQPFAGLRMMLPNASKLKRLAKVLRDRGFKVNVQSRVGIRISW